YGCGCGEDIDLLTVQGFLFDGWDPTHRPNAPRHDGDIVNLRTFLNVLKNPSERAETLRQAWQLCRRLLVAAAQVVMAGRGKDPVAFGDGVLTGRGTFQKFYEQGELRTYLEEQLGTEALPAAPGVFYLFKDETARQQFLANRFRRLPVPPRQPVSQREFE